MAAWKHIPDCGIDIEKKSVTLGCNQDGTPTLFCDPCIAPLVRALNVAGIATKASCCGHGLRGGNIALADGRELIIAGTFDEAREIERAASATSAPLPASRIAELEARIADLERLVYVPGMWRCAKCGFIGMHMVMRASDGAVGVKANDHTEACPNGCGPLWRVSERQAGNEMCDRAEEILARERALQAENAALRRVAIPLARMADQFDAHANITYDYGTSVRIGLLRDLRAALSDHQGEGE